MVEQTTLHNILTCVIAVVIFIFQSLNCLIVQIKNYVQQRGKTTTVVTADTTISSNTQPNDNNELKDFIRAEELIQKHFDIPLIVAEDEPNVNDLTEKTKLSNNIHNEIKKPDQYVSCFIDDSYVARGLGLIAAIVGRPTDFYLYSKYDNNFENIVIELKGRNGEVGMITILNQNPVRSIAQKSIPIDCSYDDDRIKVTYTPCMEGVHTLTLLRNGSPICRSPYFVSVEKSPTNSRSRIRLGTKKYKMVTKLGQGKYTPIKTLKDNTSPRAVESSKPTVRNTIRPISEENAAKTDVKSIVTKFESKSKNITKKPKTCMISITGRNSDNDMINTTQSTLDLKPKIETFCKTNNADLNSSNICKMSSKFKTMNSKNFTNEIENQYKENQLIYKNAINFNENQKNKSFFISNEHNETTSNALARERISPNQQESTSDIEEILKNKDLCMTENQNQNTEINFQLEVQKKIESHSSVLENLSKNEYTVVEPCSKQTYSRTSFSDDKDRTIVENTNESESQPNEYITQQTTDSTQYDIKQPTFINIITKITENVCETCSKQVFRILSELPRDINMSHNKSTKKVRSSFETLLTQPIRININIDNVTENANSATQEHGDTHIVQTDCSADLEHAGTSHSLNEIDNRSEERDRDINNVITDLVIERNKTDYEMVSTISAEENKTDTSEILFGEQSMETDEIHRQNIIMSANELILQKCTKDEEHIVSKLSCDLFNSNDIYNSESKIEPRDANKRTLDPEQCIDSNKSNQNDEAINREYITPTSDLSVSTLDTNKLLVMNINENLKTTLDKSKLIKNEVASNENGLFESGIIDNTIYTKEALENLSLNKEEYNELYCKKETSDVHEADYRNLTQAKIQEENQKLMVEKLIEPVLNNYFKKNIRKALQFYLKKDVSNINDTQIFENDDINPMNKSYETNLDNATAQTNIQIENNDTLMIEETNNENESENLEIEQLDSNNLLKLIDQIIKTNIILNKNNGEIMAKTKQHNIRRKIMNYSNGLQKNSSYYNDNEINSNHTQLTISNVSNLNNSNGTDESKYEKQEETKNKQLIDNIKTYTEISSKEQIKSETQQQINRNEKIVIKNSLQFEGLETKQKIPLSSDAETIMVKSTAGSDKTQFLNLLKNNTVEECNFMEIQSLTNTKKLNNKVTSIEELETLTETKTLCEFKNDKLKSINNKSSQESKTVNKSDISNGTENDTENQNNKGNQELAVPEAIENNIRTSKTIQKEIIYENIKDSLTNEIEITSNTLNGVISNNIKIVSDKEQNTSSIITPQSKNKTDNAKSYTIERKTKIMLPSLNLIEVINVERPSLKNNETTSKTLVLNGISIIKIEIDTSETQNSNIRIILSIKDSKIVLQKNISNDPILDKIKMKIVMMEEPSPLKKGNQINYDFTDNESLKIKSKTENEVTNHFDNVYIEENILKVNESKRESITSVIEITKYQQLSKEIIENTSEKFTSINTPAKAIEESVKCEEEHFTSTETLSDFEDVTTKLIKIININRENTTEDLATTDYLTLSIEKPVYDIETLNTIKTKTELLPMKDSKKQGREYVKKTDRSSDPTLTIDSLILPIKEPGKENVNTLTMNPVDIDLQISPKNHSLEEKKETMSETLTLTVSSTVADKEAVQEVENLSVNPDSNNTSHLRVEEQMEKITDSSSDPTLTTDSLILPIKEPGKENVNTLTMNPVDIDSQISPKNHSLEEKKETESETLTLTVSSTVADKEAVKEVENLSVNPDSNNTSHLRVEEQMEKITDSSSDPTLTTDSLILPIKEPGKENVNTLTMNPVDIDSQISPKNHSLEEKKETVSETLTLTVSSTVADKEAVQEVENLSVNPDSINTSHLRVEEQMEKITDSSSDPTLTIDSLILPIKEPGKENVNTLTMNPVDIDSQISPKNHSLEEKKETVSETLTLTVSSTVADKEAVQEVENLSVNPDSNNTSHLRVEEQMEKITDSSSDPTLTIDSLILPIKEPGKENVNTLTMNPVDIDSQISPKNHSLEEKKETVSETLTLTVSSTVADKEAVQEVENLSVNPDSINTSHLRVEEQMEKITDSSSDPTLTIDSLILPIKEPGKENVNTLTMNPVDIDSQISPKNHSLEEKKETVSETLTLIVSSTVVDKEPVKEVENLSINPDSINTSHLRVEEQIEKITDSSSDSTLTTDSLILPIKEPRKENVNTLTMNPVDIDLQISPKNHSLEEKKETVSETLTLTVSSTVADKEAVQEVENLSVNPDSINTSHLRVEEQMEKITDSSSDPTLTIDSLILPIKEPGKENVNTLTMNPVDIDLQISPKNHSLEEKKETVSKTLTLTVSSTVADKEAVKEVENLSVNPDSNNTSHLRVEEQMEKITDSSSDPTLTIDSFTLAINKPGKVEMETLTTASINNFLQSSMEKVVEMVKQRTLQISTSSYTLETPNEELAKIKMESFIPIPTENNAMSVPLEEINIKYKPKYFTLSNSSFILTEESVKNEKESLSKKLTYSVPLPNPEVQLVETEKENTLEHLTIVDKTPIHFEELLKEEVKSNIMVPIQSNSQIFSAKKNLEIKREMVSDNLNIIYTTTEPIEESLKVEVKILTRTLTKSNSQTFPTDESKEEDVRIIPEHLNTTVVPIFHIAQLVKDEVESNTIESNSQNLPLNKSLELNNKSLTTANTSAIKLQKPSKEEIETTTAKTNSSKGSLNLPVEETTKIIKKKKHNDQTITNVIVKQVEELVNINTDSSIKTPTDIDLQVLPAEDLSEVEKKILSEELTTADSLTISEEKEMKDKLETPPIKPVSTNTSPISDEKSMENMEENLPSNLITTGTYPIQIDNLGLVGMEITSITQKKIFSQILPINESMIVKEENILEYSSTNPVNLTEELVENKVESIITAMTKNDSQQLLINEASEVEKKVILGNKTETDIPSEPVEETAKEVIAIISTNQAEESIKKLKDNLQENLTTINNPPTPLIQIEKSKKVEMKTTSKTEIVSQIIPLEYLVQVQNKNRTKSLSVINTLEVSIKYLTKEEIESLPTKPTLNNFLPVLVKNSKEIMNKNIFKSLPAEETFLIEVEPLSNRSLGTISQVLPIEESLRKEKNIHIPLKSIDKPIIPIEEIESFIEVSIESNSQHPPTEELLKLEKNYIIENVTKTHTKSFEKLAKEKITVLSVESSMDEKIENIPESETVINNLSIPVEKPKNNEIEIIPSKLITSDFFEVQIKNTSTVEKETISKTIMEYDIPTVTADLKDVNEIETINLSFNSNNPVKNTDQIDITLIESNNSNTVSIKSAEVKESKILIPFEDTSSIRMETTPDNLKSNEIPTSPTKKNNLVVTVTESSEIEKEVISKNLFLKAPVKQSFATKKVTVPENVISTENVPKTMEKSVEVKINLSEYLTLNDIADEPVDKLIDLKKEIIHGNSIINENLVETEEEKLGIKKKHVISEHLISSDTQAIPVEDVLKDKIESLHNTSLSSNSILTQLKEPKEIHKENVHLILSTTESLNLPVDESIVKNVDSLTIKPICVDPQIILVKGLPEEEKKNLTATDSSIIPNKQTDKEKIENLPENIDSYNLSLISIEGQKDKCTESLSASLITTNTPSIQNEESSKVKTGNITSNLTEICSRFVSPENKIAEEKNNITNYLTLTDTDMQVKKSKLEELKTSTIIQDDFIPIPLEELIEVIMGNVSNNLTKTHISTAFQTAEPIHVEQNILTTTQADIITQILPKVESIEIEKDNLHLNFTRESIEQLSKKDIKTLPTNQTLDDFVPTPIHVLEEKNIETLSIKNLTMTLPEIINIETVLEPKEFQIQLSNDCLSKKKKKMFVTDELKGIKQFNTNQVLISDTMKSLSKKHSSCESIDDKSEEGNIIVDHFNIEFRNNCQNVELLCEQNDITFEQPNSVTTSNDGKNKQYDQQSDNSDTITSYCNDKNVNVEKTNNNYQTRSSIDDEVEMENSGILNSFQGFGETSSAILHSETESDVKEKSFGIQKLEMSVKSTDDDYFEKTFVQLEQTEKISMGKSTTEGENKTVTDDKLYTVNESDLNAILCASSLQEALTLLDSKIKFKFKHGTKKNSAVHKLNVQTSSDRSKTTNFAEAREYFKTIEKNSKK